MVAPEPITWDWTLLPAQQQFLTSSATYTMYSGGFGTGKTTVLCAKIIACLLGIPNNMGYLGRLDGKSLRHTTILTLRELLDSSVVQQWDDRVGKLTIRPEYGGSRLLYGDFKDINDLKNMPLGFFAIDQAEECGQHVWDYLVGRLRRKCYVIDEVTRKRQYIVEGRCLDQDGHFAIGFDCDTCIRCGDKLPKYSEQYNPVTHQPIWSPILYPRYGFGVCNPEGPSHWIFSYFPGLEGSGSTKSTGLADYQGFSATTFDALHAGFVDPSYVDNLKALYNRNSVMYDRYLLNKWVEAEGLVYPSFSMSEHVVNQYAVRHNGDPLFKPDHPVFEYIDHGIVSPTAVGWVYIEQCDCGCGKFNFWLIDEHYEAQQTINYHCQAIKRHRDSHKHPIQATYLDSACFAKTQSREDSIFSVSDQYLLEGIFVVRNQKDWDLGYDILTNLLATDPLHVHPVTGVKGAPHFLVLSHCKTFLSEITTYKWKKRRIGATNNSQEPVDKDDHHMDGINGLLASRPEGDFALKVLTPKLPEPEEFDWDELDHSITYSHMSL